ncbi:hypothetical protein NPIL_500171 [Nephila pilipes]|uniref:Uncharacterized protein n=1 Tax=Nephila pilipes TaxID=299642 RepID=A0A8X6U177_NEPPI|nr:hypothetical protein NPIL_500171 [Nephila pilipes]
MIRDPLDLSPSNKHHPIWKAHATSHHPRRFVGRYVFCHLRFSSAARLVTPRNCGVMLSSGVALQKGKKPFLFPSLTRRWTGFMKNCS